MFSRAHLLIARDHERLRKDPLWGIEAHPLTEDNIFEWTAKIKGLKDTLLEDGVFRLYIKFDENYNVRPPEVCFHTIPFHPNVDPITGKPCVDFLDDYSHWRETYSISYILLSIQALLSNPVLRETSVNLEAVELIQYNPHAYKQMVFDCVAASQRIEAGFKPHLIDEDKTENQLSKNTKDKVSPPPTTSTLKATKLSFDDYLKTWSGIATSKFRPGMGNPFLESMKDKPALQVAHYGMTIQDLQDQMSKQLHDHNEIMYGRFKPKQNDDDTKQAKVDKVNKMRRIYLAPRKTPVPPPSPNQTPVPSIGGAVGEEPWEREVDDLVAWTTKLNEDMI